MKKIILFLSVFTFLFFQSFCKNVDSATAKMVGENFYTGTVNSGAVLSLVYQCKIESFNPIARQTGENLYYVFKVENSTGFVIIAGDDIVSPVLAYGDKENYDLTNLPPACLKWMDGCKDQIIIAKENHIEATKSITEAWNVLKQGPAHPLTRGSVSPLLTTTWSQNPYYNDDCPYDSASSQLTVTGCTATAMAQIMKYWSYPAQGSGFHSYGSQHYGTLSVNFSATTYNWSLMPDYITSANSPIATLMYQCGVSANMDYNIASAGGSGAYVIAADNPVCAQTAYVTYFGYDPSTIQGLYRRNYTDSIWVSMLKNELNNSRPIQYVGYGSGGGHTWVCDGYDANNNFHMNWGWGGLADGYYLVNMLNPTALGVGGGLGDFNSNEEALIGIQPQAGGNTGVADLQLYSAITILPSSTVGFHQKFSIQYNVINNGNTSFNGYFGLGIFTLSGNIVSMVDSIKVSSPLASGKNTGTLVVSGSLFTAPGQYQLGVLYKSAGGQWNMVGGTNFANPVDIDFADPVDPINLYAPITPSPTTFTKGEPASVYTNLINSGSTTYFGIYAAALYNLNGTLAEQISALQETNGLPAGDYYNSPFPFSTDSINSKPGTYLLCMFEANRDSNNFDPIGGEYYHNPVFIKVVGKPLNPDIYEPNNAEVRAYTLPLSWQADTASAKTTGSNIHIGTDYDYYKLNLPAGYDYTITANVYDSHYGKANQYTDDVSWSYKTDSGWSAAYDDIMPGNIAIHNGGTITFFVSSLFPGTTGTYLLDIHLKRAVTSGVADIPNPGVGFSIYPNPSSSLVYPVLHGNGNIQQVKVSDVVGRVLYVQSYNNGVAFLPVDVSGFADGLYLMEATINDKQLLTRFVVTH